jgi:hypothetical protein
MIKRKMKSKGRRVYQPKKKLIRKSEEPIRNSKNFRQPIFFIEVTRYRNFCRESTIRVAMLKRRLRDATGGPTASVLMILRRKIMPTGNVRDQ